LAHSGEDCLRVDERVARVHIALDAVPADQTAVLRFQTKSHTENSGRTPPFPLGTANSRLQAASSCSIALAPSGVADSAKALAMGRASALKAAKKRKCRMLTACLVIDQGVG
jgi:hypothetical protein